MTTQLDSTKPKYWWKNERIWWWDM